MDWVSFLAHHDSLEIVDRSTSRELLCIVKQDCCLITKVAMRLLLNLLLLTENSLWNQCWLKSSATMQQNS